MFIDPAAVGSDPVWHGLKIGDWATWVAGGATFLAVCVAVGVPVVQGFLQRRERRVHEQETARILAIEMNAVMGSFLSQMLDRRQIIQTALSGAFNGNAAAFSTYVKIWGIDDLPRGGDLQGLPYPVAPSIASLRTYVTMYNGFIDRAVGLIDVKPLNVSIRELEIARMLDAAQSALARAAGHLGKYDQTYGYVNYFNDGNGGKVLPLRDYD